MDKYLTMLYKQYCEAKGIEFDCVDGNYPSDFIGWINENARNLSRYQEYLESLGYFDLIDAFEVGKGKFDSIAYNSMRMISPYAYTAGCVNRELQICNGIVLMEHNDLYLNPECKLLLTHNPYDNIAIFNWPAVHKRGKYGISIGFYGNISDCDSLSKLRVSEELASLMGDDYRYDCETDRGKYYISINSDNKKKIKVLTR